jgi:OmcA/MtrC family decaheme c-type cytochrome
VAPTNAKAHEIPEWALSKNYQLHIWSINKNANNSLTVVYSVSNPNTGTDYDLLSDTARFGNLGLLFGWNTSDYANDGGPGRGQPFSISATDASAQPVGSNRFELTSPVLPVISNTVAVAFQGRINDSGLQVPVPNVVKYFALSGVVRERRQVVSADKCNACHGRFIGYSSLTSPFLPGLGAHDASSNDPQVCVICHNGNLDATSVLSGQADSGNFNRMIHMVHRAQASNYPVMPSTLITAGDHPPRAGTYTGYTGIMNCNVCHVNGSYKQNLSVVGSSVTFNTDASSNLVISPRASTCSSCHAQNHMIQTGGAAFGTVTQGELAAGQVFESCDGCHQPGGEKPVDLVHLGTTN